MRQWAAMLEQELSGWPQVRAKPMFGMKGFFRRKKVFAVLPVSRGLMSPSSILIRSVPFSPELLAHAKKEPRISAGRSLEKTKWISFELSSEADLRDALWWLNQAYERAK
ncbi:MAG TPA: hypothetical protein VEI54_08530 [Candidatus Limnocylindrales bacterium]|nr:hypothetical protein [Candidatus Limnocylindrales bacterium]